MTVSFKLHADYHRPCCSIFEHTIEMLTVRKRSCRTVMFLHLSVSLFPGGCIPACTGQGGVYLCQADTSPAQTSLRQTPPGKHPLGRHPPRQSLQQTVHILLECILVTGHNKFVAKVIFLHLFVILFTGGVCLSACWDTIPPGADPPGADTPRTRPSQSRPPQSRHPPPLGPDPLQQIPLGPDSPGADTPPGPDPTSSRNPPPEQTPPWGADTPPPGSRLQHTVYERPVRILLKCILVCFNFWWTHILLRGHSQWRT